MFWKSAHAFLFLILLFASSTLVREFPTARGAVEESTDEYPAELHDPKSDFVVGRVIEVLRPPNDVERIELAVRTQ